MNRNAINAGVGMLLSDADACVLPNDRTRQKHLNEAARILAAAPDLLSALRECMSIMDSLRDYVCEGALHMVGGRPVVREADAAYTKARAAIAKAEGG